MDIPCTNEATKFDSLLLFLQTQFAKFIHSKIDYINILFRVRYAYSVCVTLILCVLRLFCVRYAYT